MSTMAPPHIRIDSQGRSWVDETNTKVIEIVLDRLGYGWSPEEIHFQHPHLSLAQIHAALSYYYDHQTKLDEQMAMDEREIEDLRKARGESPIVQRLKAAGLIR
jgi:uncharacterized protein (DUF433 family)